MELTSDLTLFGTETTSDSQPSAISDTSLSTSSSQSELAAPLAKTTPFFSKETVSHTALLAQITTEELASLVLRLKDGTELSV